MGLYDHVILKIIFHFSNWWKKALLNHRPVNFIYASVPVTLVKKNIQKRGANARTPPDISKKRRNERYEAWISNYDAGNFVVVDVDDWMNESPEDLENNQAGLTKYTVCLGKWLLPDHVKTAFAGNRNLVNLVSSQRKYFCFVLTAYCRRNRWQKRAKWKQRSTEEGIPKGPLTTLAFYAAGITPKHANSW